MRASRWTTIDDRIDRGEGGGRGKGRERRDKSVSFASEFRRIVGASE